MSASDLIGAAANGNLITVKELLQLKINVNYTNSGKVTALMGAAYAGCPKIVISLLEAEADINLQDIKGRSALFWAVIYNNLETAKVLLEAGADPNLQINEDVDMRNIDGDTALHWASCYGHLEIVKVLLKAGADIDLQNKDSKTARDVAKTPDIRRLLRKNVNFEDIVKYDEEGNCPICLEELESRTIFTNCGHRFHIDCLSDSQTEKCPTCRKGL